MRKLVDVKKSTALLDMDVATFRNIVKSSNNPPPFVRPSERTMLFEVDALLEWRDSWTIGGGKVEATGR